MFSCAVMDQRDRVVGHIAVVGIIVILIYCIPQVWGAGAN